MHLREARFMNLPASSNRAFGGQYGFVSPFVIEARRHLRLQPKELPSNKPKLITVLVEKAAHGLVTEGAEIGKKREAEKLADLLLEKKNEGMKEVWKRCAYLYSLESFLYKVLNDTMRLVGSEDDEHKWRPKVQTLGPFCLLLWDDPYNTRMRGNIRLYRGADLKPKQLATYRKMAEKVEYGSFQGFSSCRRSRAKAEEYGNTLFIMFVKFAFIADLSEISEYPNEEEELITPGVCFRVQGVDFDDNKGKHLVYLELRQRWSANDREHLENTSPSQQARDVYDDRRDRHRGGADAYFDDDAYGAGYDRYDRDGIYVKN